jgi:hypothetical protein
LINFSKDLTIKEVLMMKVAKTYANGLQTFENNEKTVRDAKCSFQSKACEVFFANRESFSKLCNELKESGFKKAEKKLQEWSVEWEISEAKTNSEDIQTLYQDAEELGEVFENLRNDLRKLEGYQEFRQARKELIKQVCEPLIDLSESDAIESKKIEIKNGLSNEGLSESAVKKIMKLQDKYLERTKGEKSF